MFQISLIIIGITLFLNGFLPLIQENDNGEIAVMDVLAGIFLSVTSVSAIIDGTADILISASMLLFAFTLLFIAAVSIFDLSEASFGWFCLPVTLLALSLGIIYIMAGSIILGVLWLVWMLIWLFYFLSASLNVLTTAKNYIMIFEGIIAFITVAVLSFSGILVI